MTPNGTCDIGAFEAVSSSGRPRRARATRRTSPIRALTYRRPSTSTARPEASILFTDTSQDELTSSSPDAAAGVVSSDTPETETLSNLNPGTTYYYAALADNATASTTASNVEQFKTDPGPPVISNVNVDSVTDTTATLDFSVDPQGADTTYFVEYGPDTNYGQDGPTQPSTSARHPAPRICR